MPYTTGLRYRDGVPIVYDPADYRAAFDRLLATRNEMGIKGVGESGIISPVPAIANAVEDALADRDVEVTRVPLTAASLWEALRSAQRPAGSRS